MQFTYAFEKRIGASAEIILTSGSDFMTFLILAKGRSKDLNSEAFTA